MPKFLNITALIVMPLLGAGAFSLIGLEAWHEWGGGYEAHFDRGREDMAAAYERGQHQEVIDVFETPIPIRWYFDVHLSKLTHRMSRELKIQIADSYRQTGDDKAAESLYLSALGWDREQYQAYCRLAGDCDGANTLQRVATTTTPPTE